MTRVVELFAGPGGWSSAAHDLGLRPVGIEIDEWTCATRAAAGHLTIRADVTTLDPASFGDVDGLIASPPCPDFSIAGRRAGIDGETGRLMHEVPRWVEALRPRWVACEQVPPALDWWRIFAERFRSLGYRTWCGVLNAADYGVPQHRERSFLMAHRERQPSPPWPTHVADPHGVFWGPHPQRWVSMADALGWSEDDELHTVVTAPRPCTLPAPTVALGHNAASWRLNTRRGQQPDGSTQTVTLDRPAPAVTGKSAGQWVYERPATTVQGTPRIAPPGHHDRQWKGAIAVTLPELGVLQDFPPDYPWQGNRTEQAKQIGNAVPVGLARAVLAAVTA